MTRSVGNPLPITASALPIFHECAWPFQNPVPERRDSPEATLGKSIHEFAALLVEGKMKEYAAKFAALQGEDYYTIADHARAVEEFWQGRPRGATEVTYAYDPETRTARVLGANLNRDYSGKKPGEIVGTTDYLVVYGENGTERMLIGDWKSGWADHVEPVPTNRQIRFLALCAARESKLDSIDAEIAYVRPGKVWAESTVFDYMELLGIEEELHEALASSRPEAVPGPHCRFCPGNGVCPATRTMLSRVAPGLDSVKWSAQIESTEHAASMAYYLSPLKKAVEAVEQALKDRVRSSGPLILPDGRVYRVVPMKRQSLNMTAVKNFLGDRLPEFQSEIEIEQFRVVKK